MTGSGSDSSTGRRTVKVLPWPGTLSTAISPPCWWTICRTM
jgi:hypothetical protein